VAKIKQVADSIAAIPTSFHRVTFGSRPANLRYGKCCTPGVVIRACAISFDAILFTLNLAQNLPLRAWRSHAHILCKSRITAGIWRARTWLAVHLAWKHGNNDLRYDEALPNLQAATY